jgi:hypothetical protein
MPKNTIEKGVKILAEAMNMILKNANFEVS